MHTYKLLHFGATTRQRVEGSHASIKRLLEGKMNTEEVLDRVDKMFRRKVCFLASTAPPNRFLQP
jgi:hypothetical protein